MTIAAGDRFGRLEARFFVGRKKGQGAIWHFECDCGNAKDVAVASVKRGLTKSCGCFRRETSGGKVTHGQSKTSEYRIWAGMRLRCEDPKFPNFDRWGGRGIKVCERWKSFENFLADMGPRPEGTTLDREDNDKDYEPNNCRWGTSSQQANNRSSNRRIEYKGVTRTLRQWADQMGIAAPTLKRRINNGWSVEMAMETPVRAWSAS